MENILVLMGDHPYVTIALSVVMICIAYVFIGFPYRIIGIPAATGITCLAIVMLSESLSLLQGSAPYGSNPESAITDTSQDIKDATLLVERNGFKVVSPDIEEAKKLLEKNGYSIEVSQQK